MLITSFGHSCVLVEVAGARILFDPGNFSSGFEGLAGLDAILVTHQHPDHADVAKLPALVAANPAAVLYADPQTAAQLNADGSMGQWAVQAPGGTFQVGTVTVRGTGGRHAVIHPELPVVDNTVYILDTPDRPGAFMHPGDSLYIPFEEIDVLALPAAAPWMKLSEAVDYLRGAAPRRAFPIHQAVVSDAGRGIHNARLAEMKPACTEFVVIEPGASREF
ncbi:MBL fold metallo-hydrolase [Gordonia alkaliphila]|uniref:MBL fold metallo-hydrolase n=1 Tax=Gordonia alkaliphila TaxID=1053547 RepID=UPI0031EF83DF